MKIPLLYRLWNKEPRKPLNLLSQDIVVEGHFHMLSDNSSRMYLSKLPPSTTPQDLVNIVKCLIDNAIAFGKQHGVEVKVTQQEGKP